MTDLTGNHARQRLYEGPKCCVLEDNLKKLAEGNLDFDMAIGTADEIYGRGKQAVQRDRRKYRGCEKKLSGTLIGDAESDDSRCGRRKTLENRAESDEARAGEFAKVMEGFQQDHLTAVHRSYRRGFFGPCRKWQKGKSSC